MTRLRVALKEWQTLRPDRGSQLAGMVFAEEKDRLLAERLTRDGRIGILEMARGLELRTTSFVGRLCLGGIEITIQPKLNGMPLLSLLRYAYGLRHLDLYHQEVRYSAEQSSFQDLLIRQLAAEADEIVARGLHRAYFAVEGDLTSPRGRVNFVRHLSDFPWTKATLPCQYHPRIDDNPLNQAMLGGFRYAARVTTDIDLRTHLNRLRKVLGATVTEKRLDRNLLVEAVRAMDRRTTVYKSVLHILQLLLDSNGVALDDEEGTVTLPGFLFDMNRFFQALLSRFLREHLADAVLHDEYRLKTLYSYAPGLNPRNKKAPTPRPDFVIMQNGKMKAVLDAKYRDLWGQSLPREMLYQLSLYALGRSGQDRTAVILFPTLDDFASEQVLCINDPFQGHQQGRVVLRPVNLLELERLIRQGRAGVAQRSAMADRLAYGTTSF